MIYINTNKECIAQHVNVNSDLCARYDVDPVHVANEAADAVDLEPVSRVIYDAGFDYETNHSFHDWNGGRIHQFKKRMGALVAFDDEREREVANRVSDVLDEQLRRAAADELSFFAVNPKQPSEE